MYTEAVISKIAPRFKTRIKMADYGKKFAIERPTKSLLETLGAKVDAIEGAIHDGRDYSALLDQLNSELRRPTSTEAILSHSGACSRDQFIRSHLVSPVLGTPSLSDDEMTWLISQMFGNPTDEMLLCYYGDLLDRSSTAPIGTTLNLIFRADNDRPESILRQLKALKHRVILL